ncbi:unnamed protein product [Trifolium pratense]|uniref:Uncharacterized protein n=1 Tax=Trifolium pratense TaxID=57577 RepID=A0ACB0I762_TRIPR|nr:unnamed protein product [Trifolium pratense]
METKWPSLSKGNDRPALREGRAGETRTKNLKVNGGSIESMGTSVQKRAARDVDPGIGGSGEAGAVRVGEVVVPLGARNENVMCVNDQGNEHVAVDDVRTVGEAIGVQLKDDTKNMFSLLARKVGASGGLLTLWDTAEVNVWSSESFENVLWCHGLFVRSGEEFYLANVYAPCDSRAKQILWDSLSVKIQALGRSRVCICGDFNAVRSLDERRSANEGYRPSDHTPFNRFIDDNTLIDLPLCGRKYTWFKGDGRSMSRLDRFLLSGEWCLTWPNCTQAARMRGLSDHCPLVLVADEENWGPRPSRMLKCWKDVPGYHLFVREKWNSFQVDGWGGFVLKEKLKWIKTALKDWHSSHTQNLPSRIESLKDRLAVLDVKGGEEVLSDSELAELHGVSSEIHSLSRLNASICWQQSRSRWLKEGDANTKYFHSVLASRRRGNAISSLQVDGTTVEGVTSIRHAVFSHFASHFKAVSVERPRVDNLIFKRLEVSEGRSLYLDLPIGGDPRRLCFWEPVLDLLKNRLSGWRSRFLSIGGRLVLLKSVLTSLPVYALSFFKAPSGTISSIESILIKFFWGGSEDLRKVSWINWNTICLRKEYGGLGVRQLREFNLALLGKWCWRLLVDREGLWFRVLAGRYGVERGRLCEGGARGSTWWRELARIRDGGGEAGRGWFRECVSRQVGDGSDTFFWTDPWVDGTSLRERYGRLFDLAENKSASVAEMFMRGWGAGGEAWEWRRQLRAWEEEMLGECQAFLLTISLQDHVSDRWQWRADLDDGYTVRSAYQLLTTQEAVTLDAASGLIWHRQVPLKVSICAWRLLRDRLPTKANLVTRGILSTEAHLCTYGCGEVESAQHLFLSCSFYGSLWSLVSSWIGSSVVTAQTLSDHFIQFTDSAGGSRARRSFMQLIWLACVWVVWTERNHRLFKGSANSVHHMLDKIKTFSYSELCITGLHFPWEPNG